MSNSIVAIAPCGCLWGAVVLDPRLEENKDHQAERLSQPSLLEDK